MIRTIVILASALWEASRPPEPEDEAKRREIIGRIRVVSRRLEHINACLQAMLIKRDKTAAELGDLQSQLDPPPF